MCRVIVVSYSPIIGAMFSGSVCTRYGRPERSTVTWASDSSSGTVQLPKR